MECFEQKAKFRRIRVDRDRVNVAYLANREIKKEDKIEEINTSMENMSFKNLQILTLVAGELSKK